MSCLLLISIILLLIMSRLWQQHSIVTVSVKLNYVLLLTVGINYKIYMFHGNKYIAYIK